MNLALATLSAMLTAYCLVGDPPLARLVPRESLRLPGWARPLPGALDSRLRWLIAAAAGAFVWMYFWSVTAWVTLAIPVLMFGVWLLLGRMESQSSRQRREQAESLLPETLDIMRLCVQAGQPLRLAAKSTVEVMPAEASRPLRDLLRGIDVGMTDSQAWSACSKDEAWADIAHDMVVVTRSGLPVVRVLNRHAELARRAMRTKRLAKAKAVGVKSVLPLGVCHLPAFVLLGIVPVIASGLAHVFG